MLQRVVKRLVRQRFDMTGCRPCVTQGTADGIHHMVHVILITGGVRCFHMIPAGMHVHSVRCTVHREQCNKLRARFMLIGYFTARLGPWAPPCPRLLGRTQPRLRHHIDKRRRGCILSLGTSFDRIMDHCGTVQHCTISTRLDKYCTHD